MLGTDSPKSGRGHRLSLNRKKLVKWTQTIFDWHVELTRNFMKAGHRWSHARGHRWSHIPGHRWSLIPMGTDGPIFLGTDGPIFLGTDGPMLGGTDGPIFLGTDGPKTVLASRRSIHSKGQMEKKRLDILPNPYSSKMTNQLRNISTHSENIWI